MVVVMVVRHPRDMLLSFNNGHARALGWAFKGLFISCGEIRSAVVDRCVVTSLSLRTLKGMINELGSTSRRARCFMGTPFIALLARR